MITIRSKQEGFRRCGIAHTSEPKEYQNSKFTKAQLLALQNEPKLIVTVTKDEPAGGDKGNDKDKK